MLKFHMRMNEIDYFSRTIFLAIRFFDTPVQFHDAFLWIPLSLSLAKKYLLGYRSRQFIGAQFHDATEPDPLLGTMYKVQCLKKGNH